MPENAPKESELTRGVFVTPNTIECEADATALLRLVNLIENDPRLVAVKGLKVKGGGRSAEGGDSAVPQGGAPPRDVLLRAAGQEQGGRRDPQHRRAPRGPGDPQEGRRLPARASRLVRAPAVDVAARPLRRLPPGGRRRGSRADPPCASPAEEVVVLDVEKRHDVIREKTETEKSLSGSGALFQYDRVRQELDDLVNELRVRVANVASIRSVTFPDLTVRVERVRAAARGARPGAPDPARACSRSRSPSRPRRATRSRRAFRDGNYAEVTTLSTQWEQFLRGKIVDDSAGPLNEEIRGYKLRSKRLSEFHAKGVHVTGVIVNVAQPAQSVALVNGEVRHIGEALDDKGEIRILSIARDGVEFGFQGETIRLGRADSGGTSPRPASGTSTTIDATVGGSPGR